MSSSEYVCRLCRSKVSVTSPVCGGSLMTMPAAGSRPVNTSQKDRLVVTPSPRSDGHSMTAGSVFMAGWPRPAARPLVCASTAADHHNPMSSRQDSSRTSVTHAGQACRQGRQSRHRLAFVLDQLEKLHPGPRIVTKGAEHRAGHGKRVLFLHAAHRHAQMGALTNDRHAQWIDFLENLLGNLIRHPLLDLQTSRKHVDQPWNLAQTDHMTPGNVGDVALPEKRQNVMLAKTVEINVLDDDHLVVIDGEQCAVEDGVDIGVVTAGQEPERAFDALRGADESFAGWIFAQLGEQAPDQILHDRIVTVSEALPFSRPWRLRRLTGHGVPRCAVCFLEVR